MLVPTALRLLIDTGATGVPFVFYFPAVVFTVLLAGWEYGAACAVGAALVSNWLFLGDFTAWAFDRSSLLVVALFLCSCAVLIATAQALRRTVRDVEALSAREAHLNIELQHRVKNMLTVVQALAQQSAKEADPAEFARTFGGRLSALARAHDVLSAGSLESCAMPDLIVRACEPFGDARSIRLEGPDCRLAADSCVPLALAVHELCTNAIKHGALSAEGRVEVRWTVADDGRCDIVWNELDGPPVTPPERIGLGRRLLTAQRGLAAVELDFAPAGLRCSIAVDGARLT